MSSVRVLAVEDERIVARDLRIRLVEMGYEVPAVAASSKDALRLVRDLRPHVVLMDVRLGPGPDGIETAQLLRERFDVPVIFATAHADPDTLSRATLIEPYGFVRKPFDDSALRAAIEIAVFKHRAEMRVRKTQERLVLSQRVAQMGVIERDLITGRFDVSEEACRLLEISTAPGLMSEEGLFAKVEPAALPAIREAFRVCASEGQPILIEYRLGLSDGTDRFIRQHGEVVVDSDGNRIRLLATVQNITEYKFLEQSLQRSRELEALGQLAGGVAHEFNNLLMVIDGYSQIIMADLSPADPLYPRINYIHQAAERAAGLTSELLAFGRRQNLVPQVIDLNDLVDESESILRRQLPGSVAIRKMPGPALWMVDADPVQIGQVIKNLAMNAWYSMPNGGVISIATANEHLSHKHVAGFRDLKPGRYVSLTITDTGTGIAQEHMPRLFDPFFTTKPQESGKGLGLSAAYGIVKQHSGEISVHSERQLGTMFRIYLPAVNLHPASVALRDQLSPHSSPLGPGEPAYSGNATILLVENNDELRGAWVTNLEALGYRLLMARDAAEALGISDSAEDTIDLVITNVAMPGMGGLELARHISVSRPGVKVIFLSPYAGRIVSNEALLEANVILAPRGAHLDELVRRIQEVMQGK